MPSYCRPIYAVVPVYNEQDGIATFHEKLIAIVSAAAHSFVSRFAAPLYTINYDEWSKLPRIS